MYTKAELKQQLQNAGLTGKETILIHSSMKAIGEVESGYCAGCLDGIFQRTRDLCGKYRFP